ncbi:MAG: hypothetical protein A4E67_01857 [Syntrophaceae bacterium PtaB.Bin038]|nr:MAG: hypothetical protein A4E67_01857 [Syntrophaceae bacterium PtaB.Bin038]
MPEPDTPVMAVRTPRGMAASIPLRLFSEAPRMVRTPRGLRLRSGTGMRNAPLRYPPVGEPGSFMRPSRVPL